LATLAVLPLLSNRGATADGAGAGRFRQRAAESRNPHTPFERARAAAEAGC